MASTDTHPWSSGPCRIPSLPHWTGANLGDQKHEEEVMVCDIWSKVTKGIAASILLSQNPVWKKQATMPSAQQPLWEAHVENNRNGSTTNTNLQPWEWASSGFSRQLTFRWRQCGQCLSVTSWEETHVGPPSQATPRFLTYGHHEKHKPLKAES